MYCVFPSLTVCPHRKRSKIFLMPGLESIKNVERLEFATGDMTMQIKQTQRKNSHVSQSFAECSVGRASWGGGTELLLADRKLLSFWTNKHQNLNHCFFNFRINNWINWSSEPLSFRPPLSLLLPSMCMGSIFLG